MKRRGATLLAGAILLVIMIVLAMRVTVPYVTMEPGETWNTLGKDHNQEVIQIAGAPTSTSAGQLRMVTVGIGDQISLWDALRGWLSPADAVVPREVFYPPDKSPQQVDKANEQDFQDSKSSAETAALRELGYPVQVTVAEVVAGAPAQGHLLANDVITSVDGQTVTSANQLTTLIRGKPVGTALRIGYTRSGTAGSTTITTGADESGQPRIGVRVTQKQPSPLHITIPLTGVGGPSAGLMFSLGIIDKVEPQDLTGGLHIAGTGTIDDDGVVGPIGGIAQKLRAAKRDTATVFLVPADNCAEAVANAVPGLELVKVSTLDDALDQLQTLRDHGRPTLCHAG